MKLQLAGGGGGLPDQEGGGGLLWFIYRETKRWRKKDVKIVEVLKKKFFEVVQSTTIRYFKQLFSYWTQWTYLFQI